MDLFLSILFSTIGVAFGTYGKKQQAMVSFCAGLVLLLLQYAIDNPLWLVISSLICCAIPFFCATSHPTAAANYPFNQEKTP